MMMKSTVVSILLYLVSSAVLGADLNARERNEPGMCSSNEVDQRHMVDEILALYEFQGAYEIRNDPDLTGINRVDANSVQIAGKGSLKVVVVPVYGAAIKSIDGTEHQNIESAIFHKLESADLTFELHHSGCLLVLRQESPVLPGRKSGFHYSHFINNVNPFSQLIVSIVKKEIKDND